MDLKKFACRHKRCNVDLFNSNKSRYRHEHTVHHYCLMTPTGEGCKCCMKKLLKTYICVIYKEYKTTRRDNLTQHYKSCSKRSPSIMERKSKFEELICEAMNERENVYNVDISKNII